MSTTKIMLVRHAEKPEGNVLGVTPDGKNDPEALIVQGWQRAGALIGVFSPAPGQVCRPGLATPQRLFASGSTSERPQETLQPLADKLGVDIDASIKKEKTDELVKRITEAGGIVLVAWQHEDIPAIAGEILGSDGICPPEWPENRFDLVWVLDRSTGIGPWSFSQIPQLILAGDQASVIPITSVGQQPASTL
jgi:hypothetical protein